MGSDLTTYGALGTAAPLVLAAQMQRFGSAPIVAAHGTRVPGAAQLAAATPNVQTTAVDRKADDRVSPRGRPL